MIEAGDARMVCDPITLDSTGYVIASCSAGEFEEYDKAEENAKSVCDKANGKFCVDDCFFTTQASKEDSLTSRFMELCTGQKNPDGSSYQGYVHVHPTKAEAEKTVYSGKCKNQFP